MSVRALTWGWQVIFSGILENKNAAKLVLLRLADRADPEGVCWPGHQKTARELRLSKSIVKDSIKTFEQLNLLHKKHRLSEEGDSTSNLYILNLNYVPLDDGGGEVGQPPAHPEKDRQGGSTSGPPGPLGGPPVGQPQAHGGSTSGPEPKKEPVTGSSSSTREPAPATAGAGAAAAESVECAQQNKALRSLRVIHGVVCWNQEDQCTTAALLETFGLEALEAAAAAVLTGGATPLPSRVLDQLQRLTSAAQERQRGEQAEARLACLDAESRRRGVQDMAELLATQANQARQERAR